MIHGGGGAHHLVSGIANGVKAGDAESQQHIIDPDFRDIHPSPHKSRSGRNKLGCCRPRRGSVLFGIMLAFPVTKVDQSTQNHDDCPRALGSVIASNKRGNLNDNKKGE